MARWQGHAQLLLLGWHVKVRWQGIKPFRLQTWGRADLGIAEDRFQGGEINTWEVVLKKRKWGQTPGSNLRAGLSLRPSSANSHGALLPTAFQSARVRVHLHLPVGCLFPRFPPLSLSNSTSHCLSPHTLTFQASAASWNLAPRAEKRED